MRAIDFHGELAQVIAILSQLGFDGISALGALVMLGFELLHCLGAVLHVLGEGIELSVEFGALPLDCGKLCWPAQFAVERASRRAA